MIDDVNTIALAESLCITHTDLLNEYFLFVEDTLYANMPGILSRSWKPIKSFSFLQSAIKQFFKLPLTLEETKEVVDLCRKNDYIRQITKEQFLAMK